MRRTLHAIALSLLLSPLAAFAADPAAKVAPAEKPVTAQQQRMKDCNAKATGMKGETRKAFMSKCLAGDAAPAAAAALTPQQQKMKDCNAKAAGMKGADRKAFMSKCLKAE